MDQENKTVDIVCTVQPGRMTVSVSIDRAKDSSQLPRCSYQEVLDVLEANNLSNGIKKFAIEKAIAAFLDTKKRVEVIAVSGTPPVKGPDGKVEWLIQQPTPPADKLNNDGSELMRVSPFIKISKGQPVCRLTSPMEGTPGTDVFNKPVAAESGSPAVLPTIKNTLPNPQDPASLVSGIDGIAVYEGDAIRVYPCQFISGNINPHTGAVKFDGSIWVGGDVQAGAHIEATGHIQIRGTLEDAVVIAQSVRVECGFISTGTAGPGTGSITAKGDVQVNFIRNQSIRSEGNIYIKQEAINSNLYSLGKIAITGKGLGLAGGSAFAVESMHLSALGSSTDAKTEIALGRDPKLWAKRIQLMDEIEKINAAIPMLAKKLSDIEAAKKRGMVAFDKLIAQMEKIMENKTTLDMKLMTDKSDLQKINAEMKTCEAPKLKVSGSVYRGVNLDFLGFRRIIQKPANHVMYYVSTGEIVETVFTD